MRLSPVFRRRRPRSGHLLILLLVALIGLPLLTACGKKPSAVLPPAGTESKFPRSYPDPASGTGVWTGGRPESDGR